MTIFIRYLICGFWINIDRSLTVVFVQNDPLLTTNPQIKNSKQIVLSMFQCHSITIDKQPISNFRNVIEKPERGSPKRELSENGYREYRQILLKEIRRYWVILHSRIPNIEGKFIFPKNKKLSPG